MKFVLLLLTIATLRISPAFAAETGESLGDGSQLVEFINSIIGFITGLIAWVIPIAGALVGLMAIYGGVLMITGQQDVGKKTVMAAITGAIIVVLSYFMVRFLRSFLEGN